MKKHFARPVTTIDLRAIDRLDQEARYRQPAGKARRHLVAYPGETVDGRRFIPQAIAHGAHVGAVGKARFQVETCMARAQLRS